MSSGSANVRTVHRQKSYHRGLDFAGKRGSDVVAVAAGVVVRAEQGLATATWSRSSRRRLRPLYAHNQENAGQASVTW